MKPKSSQPKEDLPGFSRAPSLVGCPTLGVGFGLRRPLFQETMAHTQLIDWLEITPENYMGKGGKALRQLEEAMSRFPLVSHGVSLSIGSTDPWDEQYLSQLERLFEHVNPPWFSDHLCFSGINWNYFNDLIPLLRTPDVVNHVVDRICFLQDRFQRPVLIENASFYLEYPENKLSDSEFHAQILEKADCGLLLDVNNVFVNSQNHGFDPIAYLNDLPLNRVVQIHTAGHHIYPEGRIDTHGNPVCAEVWDLLDYTLSVTRPCGVMLERDLYIPEFDELRPELEKIRTLWEKHYATEQKALVSR
ncbi:MAG: DUF692 domain-containing protein [Cyanobacteria bacterium]|nr:DUF692 domain-containing protein [Cyanobacteriota bacterium]